MYTPYHNTSPSTSEADPQAPLAASPDFQQSHPTIGFDHVRKIPLVARGTGHARTGL